MFFTYLRFLRFTAGYLRLKFSVTINFAIQFYSHFILHQSHFKVWFSCNHISILHEINSYRTIWHPHAICVWKYHLFAISFEHHFFPTCRRESLQLLSRYETDSTDSYNWISLTFTSLYVFFFRLIVKGMIIG